MTMRTYRYFECPSGHKGYEKTSENDQPFSSPWESVTTTGLIEDGSDQQGYARYICMECRKPMSRVS